MQPAAKWILLVEDELDIRQYIRECIEDHLGHSVKIVEASDGVEAKEQLIYQSFDCIVSDLVMPRLNGVSFIQYVRSHNLHRNTPIIVVTGHGSPTLRQDHPDIQVLPKPFDALILATLIQEQLNLGRLDDRNRSALVLALIQSCEVVLGSNLKFDLVVRQPMFIKRSENIAEGDQAILITLRTAERDYALCLSIDNTLVEKLQSPREKGLPVDILESLWTQIHRSLVDSLTLAQSASPEVLQIETFTNLDTAKFRGWMQLSGVGISEVTRHGCFHLSLLNCPQGLISLDKAS